MQELYWRYSFYELIQRFRLRYGEMVAVQLCQYSSLVQVVNAALGGSEAKPKPTALPSDPDLAVAQINRMLTF